MKKILIGSLSLIMFSVGGFATADLSKKVCISYTGKNHRAKACVGNRCVILKPSTSAYLSVLSADRIGTWHYECHHLLFKTCKYKPVRFFIVDGSGNNGVKDKQTIVIMGGAHVDKSDKCS